MDDLKQLADSEGAYQPILINGAEVHPGWRECYERWETIKPHLDEAMTIMDIGSHYGYFTLNAALTDFAKTVWSMESDPRRAEIQRRVLSENKIDNAILSRHKFTLPSAQALAGSCFTADAVLLLSVAHYFPPAELPGMIEALSLISPVLIIEFPSKDEADVASRDNVQSTDIQDVLRRYYKQIELIGAGRSPKHEDVARPIYKCSNPEVYRWGRDNPDSKKHELSYYDGRWHIDGEVRRYSGMTLENLRHYGMMYPEVDAILLQAAKEYQALIDERKGAVTDIHIRNVLKSGDRLELIDFDEGVGSTMYGIPWDDYVKRTLSRGVDYHAAEFKEMWRGVWTP